MEYYISYEHSDGTEVSWEAIILPTIDDAKDYAKKELANGQWGRLQPDYASISEYGNEEDEGVTVWRDK